MVKRELKGIDGWLLVFMAGLILAALIYLVTFGIGLRNQAMLAERYGPLPLEIALSGWVYNLSRIIIPLLIFWRMLRVRRWSSILFALVGIWLLSAGIPLLDYAYAVWQMPGSLDLSPLIRVLLYNSFFAVGATAYLLASTRVANTYPRTDSPEVIAQDFE